MCGFAGVISKSAFGRERLKGSLGLLRHRGPDDEAVELGEGWALGFRRLSILDLSPAGRQPMKSDDGTCILVCNGEIYNYHDLRRELERRGERFRSTGDTEVLLRMLCAEGAGCLERLNGMFAFVFVDLRARTFLIVRDRLGVKPVYYAQHDGSLLFASEMPALAKLIGDRGVVDGLALNRYMVLGHIPPPMTIWKNVRKLEPGHYLKGNLDNPLVYEKRRWWLLDGEPDRSKNERSWLDEVDGLLADATRLRLASDVPVGVFLSGGIDSSLAAHYAAVQGGERKPVAVTVSFGEQDYDEKGAAAEVARSHGLEHRLVPVRFEMLDELPRIAWHAGEPFADASIVNQYFLSKASRSIATVFLTGDGGDEAFGGYDEYFRMSLHGRPYSTLAKAVAGLPAHLKSVVPAFWPVAQQIAKLSAGGNGFGALVRQNVRDPVALAMIAPDLRTSEASIEDQAWNCWEESRGLPLVSRMQRYDYQMYLEPDVLAKVDRATMAHSIEARSPFLDYRVVELAAKIPVDLQVSRNQGKRLLRALARRHVTRNVARLPKKGFGLPVRRWLGKPEVFSLVSRVLTEERTRARGWMNAPHLREMLRHQARGRGRDLSDLIWRALMLETWARVLCDGTARPEGTLEAV